MKKEHDMMSSLFADVDSPEKFSAALPIANRIDPEFVKMLGPNPTYNPQTIDAIKSVGISAADHLKMAEDATKSFATGDKAHGLALAVAGTTSDEDLQGALKYAQANNAPPYLLQKYQGVKWSPELVAAAKTEAIGPEKSAELADKVADNARQDATQAETAKQHGITNANEAERIRLEKARLGLEAKRATNETVTPNDILGMTHTTLSGKRYLDMNDFEGMKEKAAARHAAQAAGLVAVDAKTGASLKAIDSAKQNAQEMWRQVSGVLPKDASGRIITGPENTLARIFQTNPQLGAFGAWRTAAIQQVQALAEPGMGLRINQAEIKAAMDNDIPQETDTVQVAAQRLKNLFTMLGNKENDALTMDRSTLVQGGDGPKSGDKKPLTGPGYPAGSEQTFINGKWVRTK
jgi:hypothetical protein